MSNLNLRMVLIAISGILVGALVTSGIFWYNSLSGVKPYIVEGYSTGTNYNGTALGVSEEPGGGGNSYNIAGAFWREFGGPWHDKGSPPSLAWPSYGQRVRLGVIDYRPIDQAPGSSAVVWYEVIDIEHKVTQ